MALPQRSSTFPMMSVQKTRSPLVEKSTNSHTAPNFKVPGLSLKAHARRALRTSSKNLPGSSLRRDSENLNEDSEVFVRAATLQRRGRRSNLKRLTRMREGEERILGGQGGEVGFEDLPETVRRKYFSTLERLRFAQAAAQTRSPLPSRMASLRLPMHRSTPSTDSTFDLRPPTSGGNRLRKRRPSEVQATQIDAQWFLNLPEAIKRKHFTREEQILLAGEYESIIVDAADEALYRLKTANRSNQSMASNSSQEEDPRDRRKEEEDEVEMEKRQDEPEAETPSSPQTPGWNQSFAWTDPPAPLDLKLDDYHRTLASTTTTTQKKSRLSFRKTLQFPKHTRTESFSLFTPPSSRRASLITRRPQQPTNSSLPRAITFQPATRPSLALDSEAQYYQDPEARLKLRVYLASPQKFDEAIEFGFPSTAPEPAPAPKASRPPTGTTTVKKVQERKEKSFLFNEERGAFEEIGLPLDLDLEEKKDEVRISTAEIQPSPESSPTQHPARLENYEGQRQRPANAPHQTHYRTISTANREMTLRMTLTRPDLRADEKVIYGWQGEGMVRASTESGAFFDGNWEGLEREGKLRRVWRRVARR